MSPVHPSGLQLTITGDIISQDKDLDMFMLHEQVWRYSQGTYCMDKCADIYTVLIAFLNTRELMHCHQQQSTTVDIHQRWDQVPGGVSVSCLASRTRHECPRHNESVYINTILIVWTSEQIFLFYEQVCWYSRRAYCMSTWPIILMVLYMTHTVLIAWTSVWRYLHGTYCMNTWPIILMVLYTWHT